MIDSFDYKEPRCATCGGEEFYYGYKKGQPKGRIDVGRVMQKLDSLFEIPDYVKADELLKYWQKEAEALNDYSGELSVLNEMTGLYRRTRNEKDALKYIERALKLIDENDLSNSLSVGTIYLDIATTLGAFSQHERALSLFFKTKEIYDANLKPTDTKYAGLFNNMALTYVELNEIEKAENLFYKAIDILNANNTMKLEVAITYVNLACMYFNHLGFDEVIDKVNDCMEKAYVLLIDKEHKNDGYYRFVCSKCIPAFEQFYFDKYVEELNKRMEICKD